MTKFYSLLVIRTFHDSQMETSQDGEFTYTDSKQPIPALLTTPSTQGAESRHPPQPRLPSRPRPSEPGCYRL